MIIFKNKVVRNSTVNVLGFLINGLTLFLIMPFIVEKLGLAVFGTYCLITAFIAPLTIGNLGFGEATIKFFAQHYSKGDIVKANSYLSTTLIFNILVGLIGAVIILIIGNFWGIQIWENPSVNSTYVMEVFFLIAFWFFLTQLNTIMQSVPIATQNYTYLTLGTASYTAINAILNYFFLSFHPDLIYFILSNIIAQIFLTILWYFLSKQINSNISFIPKFSKTIWKDSYNYGSWRAVSQVGGIISGQSEKYILGISVSSASVGIYNICQNLETNFYTIGLKATEVLFPFFSSKNDNDKKNHVDMMITLSLIFTIFSTSIILSLIPVGYDFLKIWLDEEVAKQGKFILIALCVAGTIGSAGGVSNYYFLGIGKSRISATITIYSSLTILVGATILIPVYGINAAALASVIAMVVKSVVQTYYLAGLFKGILTLKTIIFNLYVPIVWGLLLTFSMGSFLKFYANPTYISILYTYGLLFIINILGLFLASYLNPYCTPYMKMFLKKIFEKI